MTAFVLCRDAPDTQARRASVLQDHNAHLARIYPQIMLAAPLMANDASESSGSYDPVGSLFGFDMDFRSAEAAMVADPYWTEGVWIGLDVFQSRNLSGSWPALRNGGLNANTFAALYRGVGDADLDGYGKDMGEALLLTALLTRVSGVGVADTDLVRGLQIFRAGDGAAAQRHGDAHPLWSATTMAIPIAVGHWPGAGT